MLLGAAAKEEHMVGKYRVVLLLDENGNPIGAIIEGPRLTRPVYIAASETSAPKIPKAVRRFLRKRGFKVAV